MWNADNPPLVNWRSVEDQNCVLVEACASTCKKSKLNSDTECVILQYYFVLFIPPRSYRQKSEFVSTDQA